MTGSTLCAAYQPLIEGAQCLLHDGLKLSGFRAWPVGLDVDGQNSWELGRVEMEAFESYLKGNDKIDGNWVWCCKLARKLKMTK